MVKVQYGSNDFDFQKFFHDKLPYYNERFLSKLKIIMVYAACEDIIFDVNTVISLLIKPHINHYEFYYRHLYSDLFEEILKKHSDSDKKLIIDFNEKNKWF